MRDFLPFLPNGTSPLVQSRACEPVRRVVPPVTQPRRGDPTLRRSNRLVLLVGIFLAIVAFVGILLLSGSGGIGGTPRASQPPTEGPVVVATTDIPLSSKITSDQLSTKVIPRSAMLPGAFTDVSQAIGQIARQPVTTGGQITTATITGGATGTVVNVQVPVGQRAIAMRVDQI